MLVSKELWILGKRIFFASMPWFRRWHSVVRIVTRKKTENQLKKMLKRGLMQDCFRIEGDAVAYKKWGAFCIFW